MALIVSRVVAPASKLSTLTWWADTTLGADLGAKASRQHDEYGRPYRSFRGLLAHLATLTRNQVRFAGTATTVPMLAEPTSTQREAFDLIGAPIPLALT